MVVGGTPAGVDSGKAIESLRKIDNTRMSLDRREYPKRGQGLGYYMACHV